MGKVLDAATSRRPVGVLGVVLRDLVHWARGLQQLHRPTSAFHQFVQMSHDLTKRMAGLDRIEAAVRSGQSDEARLWVEEFVTFAARRAGPPRRCTRRPRGRRKLGSHRPGRRHHPPDRPPTMGRPGPGPRNSSHRQITAVLTRRTDGAAEGLGVDAATIDDAIGIRVTTVASEMGVTDRTALGHVPPETLATYRASKLITAPQFNQAKDQATPTPPAGFDRNALVYTTAPAATVCARCNEPIVEDEPAVSVPGLYRRGFAHAASETSNCPASRSFRGPWSRAGISSEAWEGVV